jgi:hypothetical protein
MAEHSKNFDICFIKVKQAVAEIVIYAQHTGAEAEPDGCTGVFC